MENQIDIQRKLNEYQVICKSSYIYPNLVV